jgi:protein O-GlcNAc transferase
MEQGLALCAEKRWTDAGVCFEALVRQEPSNPTAWNNLGNVRDELGNHMDAIAAYQCALSLNSNYQSPKTNLAIVAHQYGTVVYAEGKLDKALQLFGMAVAQGSKAFNYDHSYLQLLLETCTHKGVSEHVRSMHEQTHANEKYQPHPYPFLAAKDDPEWHLLAAKRHVERLHTDSGIVITKPVPKPLPFKPAKTERIRIAYLSSDWHINPVPQQLLPAIEAHDRAAFEVIGIATDTVQDGTPWRKRIEAAFERFYALGHLTDAEIAEQLHAMDIDIAIDLSLYMLGGRPMILQSRPCRVQIAFLGYAGTSGAPWIDYSIADEVTVPTSHECFYSEKIIRVPGSFMPDNNERPIVRVHENQPAALIQYGLPEHGFVFCAFNNPYKITPEILACWFRILHAVPKSVLWLQANNSVTQANLQTAAKAAGLDTERLVFAKRVDSFAEHLQRYALADLFLDTFPYNAHVTAADALWAGLPVLTLQGQSFASRVASSILTALGLQELITTDMASYEARALELATDAVQLKALRDKLASNKADVAYFNQAHYARGLEASFKGLARRQDAAQVPTRNSCSAHRARQILARQTQALRALWERVRKVLSAAR